MKAVAAVPFEPAVGQGAKSARKQQAPAKAKVKSVTALVFHWLKSHVNCRAWAKAPRREVTAAVFHRSSEPVMALCAKVYSKDVTELVFQSLRRPENARA
jgi:hypothetical protein